MGRDDNQALFGAPVSDTGSAVNPMISPDRGGTAFNNANPFSKTPFMADGGAIPESDPNYDPTTNAVAKALGTVNQVLMYGRQKHGLPFGGGGGGGFTSQPSSTEGGGSFGASETQQNSYGSDDTFGASDTQENSYGSDDTFGASDTQEGSYSFADGGAVPTDEGGGESWPLPDQEQEAAAPAYEPGGSQNEDLSGVTAPVQKQDDNSGVYAIPMGETKSQQPQQSGMSKILAYLMGTDAMPPQAADQFVRMSDGDAARAIDLAVQSGGEDAGWGLAQYFRRKYDLTMNHARAAANNDDYENAANSIMMAFANVPDGKTVQAAPDPTGVILSVDGGQPTPLTREQLDQLTDTGKGGQFDAVLERGVQPTIQQIAQSNRGTATIGKVGAGFPGAPSAKPRQKENLDPNAVSIRQWNGSITNGAGQKFPTETTPGNETDKHYAARTRYELGLKNLEARAKSSQDITARHDASITSREKIAQQNVDQRKMAMENQLSRLGYAEAGKNFRQMTLGETNREKIDQAYNYALQQAMRGAGQFKGPQGNAPQSPQAPQPGGGAQMSQGDRQQAAAWARANPNDPRAKKIMQLLGQ